MALRGVPGGAEVWTIDGKRYLVWYAPNTKPKVPMAWRIKTDSDWEAISGGGTKGVKITKMTKKEARKRGITWQGTTDEIRNKSEHPWEVLKQRWKEEAAIRPWLKDPEVLGKVAAAYLEGRDVSDAELRTTRWWQTRSQAEREWAQLVNADPSEARKQREENRLKVSDALRSAGMQAPPESLVKFLSDDFSRGRFGEEELKRKIAAAVDPFAPGAGPFAGLDPTSLEGVGRLVSDGKRLAIRTKEGDWLIRGEGSMARFGGHDAAKKVKKGKIRVVGDASEIAGRLRGEGPDGLGGYEQVREELLRTVGPRLAGQYGDDWIRSEAGKVRQNEQYLEELKGRLRTTFQAAFGDIYGDEAIYADVAPGVRASMEQVWGRTVDEDSDEFYEAMRRADLAERRRYLVQAGLKQGVSKVVDDGLAGLLEATGGNVRRAA